VLGILNTLPDGRAHPASGNQRTNKTSHGTLIFKIKSTTEHYAFTAA